MKITLGDAARLSGGRLHADSDTQLLLDYVCSDSREAIPGRTSLFAALKGERTDGGTFVPDIIASGNAALISDPALFEKNTIYVNDVRAALRSLAAGYRREYLPALRCVCVTGSVGKTTTKEMTALVLSRAFSVSSTSGNLNSTIGLPLSLLRVDEHSQACVLEIGMSGRGEIAPLSEAAMPDVAIITNIGTSHIEFLGSREEICREKTDIASGLKKDGVLILNGDEPLLTAAAKHIDRRCVFVSLDNTSADYHAEDISSDGARTFFTAVCPSGSVRAELPALGDHNVRNALSAIAAGEALGISPADCASALKEFCPVGSRQNIYEKNGVKVIADCYNSSPESTAAALSVLRTFPRRRIAVLGDMLELGDYAKQFHRETGARVCGCADVLVTVGTLAGCIAQGAASAGFDVEKIRAFGENERERAVDYIRSLVGPGDTVLFKASRRMDFDKILKLSGLS